MEKHLVIYLIFPLGAGETPLQAMYGAARARAETARRKMTTRTSTELSSFTRRLERALLAAARNTMHVPMHGRDRNSVRLY